MANIQRFIDLCGGVYGRKVCYTDVDTITPQNIVKVLGNAIGTHNFNRPLMKYLYTYYKGDQPVLYREKIVRPEINNRVCENHALETVRFKTSQTFGEPIQYVCKKKDASAEINSAVDTLNDYMDEAHAESRNIQLGTYQSALGTAYKTILKNENWRPGIDEIPFSIFIPDPINTFVIYSSKTGLPMMSVQELKDISNQQYYLCYTQNLYFKIKNSRISDWGINGFGDIPIVEYPNNADRLSDVEICITMFDTMNDMQSSRMDGIEQFVQALMLFKNCEVTEDEFLKMLQSGAISVKDVNSGVNSGMQSDVKMLTSELNQEQTQVAKDDLYKQMLIIEGMPDRQQNTGGDTGQAVYLRNGWDFAEQRAKLDEPFIKEAEKRFAKVVLNIIRNTSKDVPLSTRDFDIKISRNSTDNMLVKAQALDYLFKNKIHPLIALITCGLFSDPQKVYEMSKPYIESLYAGLDNPEQEMQKAQQLLQQKDEIIDNQEGEPSES